MLAAIRSLFPKAKRRSAVTRAVNAASEAWPDAPSAVSGAADYRQAAQTVAQRVAGLYVNDPVVRSAVELLVAQIAGTGTRLNTADNELDAAFNDARFDPSRRLSSTAIQRAAMRSWALAGEVLGIHRVVDGRYAFQLLDPEQLDRSKNEIRADAGSIVAGVETDARGVVVAYWILPHAPSDPFATVTASERFDADDVIHVFEAEFPGQVRGMSPLVAALPVLNQASIAVEARLKQLQVAAMLSVILTSADGADVLDGDPNPSLEPGAIIRARPGEDVSVVNGPQSPEFGEFLKALYRQIAAALGVTYEALAGDLEGTNYSSFRGGDLVARRKAEARRKVLLIEGVLDPIYKRWLAVERLAGRTVADEAANWIQPGWPEIDPLKSATADIALVESGLKSRKEVIAARGRDFDAVNAEIESDERTPGDRAKALAKEDSSDDE